MSGLLRAEFRRLFSRRLFRLLGALVLLGLLVSAGVTFAQSRNDPRSGLVEAQQQVAACEQERSAQARVGGEQFAGRCPTVDEIRPAFDKRFNYVRTIPEATRNIAIPFFFLSFIVGASFMGAEWGTGMMTTWLTWEPRRGRVLTAKAMVAVVVVATAVVVFLALMALVYLPVGALRGTTEGMTAAVWRTLSGTWLRAAGIAAFGAALGTGVATLTRNTAGAVGIGFAYGAIIDALLSQLWRGRFRPWLFQHLLPRLLGLPVDVPAPDDGLSGLDLSSMTLGIARPIVLLTIYAAAILLLAYAAFRARDVT